MAPTCFYFIYCLFVIASKLTSTIFSDNTLFELNVCEMYLSVQIRTPGPLIFAQSEYDQFTNSTKGRRGHDRVVVGFTITCAFSVYHK